MSSVLYNEAVNCEDYIVSVIDESVWSIAGITVKKGTEVFADKPVPVLLCPSQIPHGLTWD
jgi:hypothetical protein